MIQSINQLFKNAKTNVRTTSVNKLDKNNEKELTRMSTYLHNQLAMFGKRTILVFSAAVLTLSLVLPILFTTTANAVRIERSYGGTTTVGSVTPSAYTWGNSIAVDSVGNQYVAGTFAATVDFDPGAGTDNHTSNGIGDAFLTKYNANGSYGWTRTWGGTGNDSAMTVFVETTGAVYVSGSYSATVDFEPSPSTDNRTSNGFSDLSLTKYNSDGSYVWTKTWGGTGSEFAVAHNIDTLGAIYVSGSYFSTVDFDPGAGTDNRTSNGDADLFITKYNPDGSYVWTKTWGGTGGDYTNGLIVDSIGAFYVNGLYQNTVDFDPGAGTDNHTSNGGYDASLTKFNTDGTYGWTRTWGGTGTDSTAALTIDTSGAIYVSGNYENTVDFDPSPTTDNRTSNGGNDAFLTKYNPDGNYVWTRTWGGTGSDSTWPIIIDSSNTVYVAGYFASLTADFDPSAGVNTKTSDGSGDGYLSTFSTNGTYLDTLTFGGSGYEEAYSMAKDSNDNIYMTGWVDSTSIDFNLYAGTDTKTPYGNGDMFLTKLNSLVYQNITGLPASLKVFEPTSGDLATDPSEGILRTNSATVKLSTVTDIPVADVIVSLTADRNWTGVTAESDVASFKSVVSGLSTASGVTGSHSLYIPKRSTDNAVYICPIATTLSAVTTTCPNVTVHREADSDTSIVNIAGQDYWLVTGLSGTGGVSGVAAASTGGSLADTGLDTTVMLSMAGVIATVGLVGGVVIVKRR